jgi:hypothetical protein
MSDRIGLDVPPDSGYRRMEPPSDINIPYDYRLADFPSLEALASAAAWNTPMRVFFTNPLVLAEFLQILDDKMAQEPSTIWTISRWCGDRWECVLNHPSWKEVDAFVSKELPWVSR